MRYSFSQTIFERRHLKEYAVVIFLPDPLEQMVASLRSRFDPDYDLIQAHLTLVYPFQTEKPLDDISRIVRAVVQASGPLKVQLESVGDFYPRVPIIYWAAGKTESLFKLQRELYAKLDLPLPTREFIPHVTIAREISDHRVLDVKDRIASFIRPEKFEPTSVDLVAPVVDEKWVSVRTFAVPQA